MNNFRIIIAIVTLVLLAQGCFTKIHKVDRIKPDRNQVNPRYRFNPDEFEITYKFTSYSRKLLERYRLEIRIGPNNFGEILYSPCASALFKNYCKEEIFITESDLRTIYDALVRNDAFERQWQQYYTEDSFQARKEESLLIYLNDEEYFIPPFLEFDTIPANDIYETIRSIIPMGTWIKIEDERREFYNRP